MEISAVYTVQMETGSQTKIVRKGDVSVEYYQLKDKLSVPEVALKAFFKKKFEAMFKPEFEAEGIKFKERLEKIGILRLEQFVSDSGWLTLGWQLRPADRTAKAE